MDLSKRGFKLKPFKSTAGLTWIPSLLLLLWTQTSVSPEEKIRQLWPITGELEMCWNSSKDMSVKSPRQRVFTNQASSSAPVVIRCSWCGACRAPHSRDSSSLATPWWSLDWPWVQIHHNCVPAPVTTPCSCGMWGLDGVQRALQSPGTWSLTCAGSPENLTYSRPPRIKPSDCGTVGGCR